MTRRSSASAACRWRGCRSVWSVTMAVKAPSRAGGSDGRAGRRRRAGGTRSARVTPSSAPATASRTRIQSRLTVQDDGPIAGQVVARLVLGRADHRRERPFEGAEDLAHRDRLRRASELVAAVGAAGRDDEAGVAKHERELLEVGPGHVLGRGDLGEATPGPAPKCRPSWTISRTPYSPFVLNATAPVPWNDGRCGAAAAAVAVSEARSGDGPQSQAILSGLSVRTPLRSVNRAATVRSGQEGVDAPRGRHTPAASSGARAASVRPSSDRC